MSSDIFTTDRCSLGLNIANNGWVLKAIQYHRSMKAYLTAPDEEFDFRGGEKGKEEGVFHNHEETLPEGPELLFY